MSDVFPIKALNNLVSKYCCLYLTATDYAAAANRDRNKGECTLAYYCGNKQLIVKTIKSTDTDEVIKCDKEADGCLTLFGSCEKMFCGATSFNSDIGAWDVSAVTNMVYMFSMAASFDQDISGWDVSSVTDMGWMFHGAESFNQNIGAWDVFTVISMNGMFFNAKSFNQVIGAWDVSAATDMRYMFFNAKSFNQDISAWDVSAVTGMYSMFLNSGVTQIPHWRK